MRIRLTHQISFVLAALFVVGMCLVNVDAQTQRKRSRRITNPVINTPAQTSQRPTSSTTDASIISTAEDQNAQDASERPVPTSTRRTNRTRTHAATESDPDNTQQTINKLTTQVTQLSSKLSEMEQQQRTLVDLERLSRAETRAEGLRAQLRDVEDKRGNLEARAEQIQYEITPENIERAVATYGSTRPEELRDMRRRQLESEQKRVLSQLETMKASQSRLETAIANADAEAERIRARIDAASNGQQNADANGNSIGPSSTDNSTPLTAPLPNTSDTSTIPPPTPRRSDASPSSTPR